jgi:iron complex outermembrane receptor protein
MMEKVVFTVSGQYIDDRAVFYLPYPLDNNDGTYERPTGNDGETVYTTLTSQATSFSSIPPNGRYNSQINNGVMTKGGYLMGDFKYNFDNDFVFLLKGGTRITIISSTFSRWRWSTQCS